MAGKGRRYAPEFKARMVELVRAGRSADRLAREFDPLAPLRVQSTTQSNGVAERFIRRLKEECIHLREFETLEEAREVIGAFIERYNNGWLLQRHGYLTPARAREKLSRRAA